ncbi:MAG: helix-turn-helix transcriptional regulator [Nitrospira sp.]
MFTSDVDRAGFGKRLKELIKTKGSTQRSAAEALGIPETQLSRYLIGQVPEPGKLFRIAQWAGCSMEWLLTGSDTRMETVTSAKAQEVPTSQWKQRRDQATKERLQGLWKDIGYEMTAVGRSRLPDIVFALEGLPNQQWWDSFLEAIASGLLPEASSACPRSELIRARAHSMGLLLTLYLNGLSQPEAKEFFRQLQSFGGNLVAPNVSLLLKDYAGRFRKPFIAYSFLKDLTCTLLKSMLTILKEEGFSHAEFDSVCDELYQVAKAIPRPELVPTDWNKSASQEVHEFLRNKLTALRTKKFNSRTWEKFLCDLVDELATWPNSPPPGTLLAKSTRRKRPK